MKLRYLLSPIAVATCLILSGCDNAPQATASTASESTDDAALLVDASRLSIYHPVTLTSDLSHLSANQKDMVSLLIDAAKIMDDLFWKQAFYGNKEAFLNGIDNDDIRHFAAINYGPWDRLNGDTPFLGGYADKAFGAEFYPSDMEKAEFATA